MLVQVIRIKHRDTVDGGDEARADARRCIDALRKKFVPFEFVGQPGRTQGEFTIKCEADEHPPLDRIAMFAEGFMASAHLWER